MTSRQWADWLAYLRVFPLPADRADINTALTRATILASAGAKRVDAAKLIPTYGHVHKRRSERDIKSIAMGWAASSAQRSK